MLRKRRGCVSVSDLRDRKIDAIFEKHITIEGNAYIMDRGHIAKASMHACLRRCDAQTKGLTENKI
jgi:hypothetical protein